MSPGPAGRGCAARRGSRRRDRLRTLQRQVCRQRHAGRRRPPAARRRARRTSPGRRTPRVRPGWRRRFAPPARLVPSYRHRFIKGCGDVRPGQQRRHRPGKRGASEHHGPLDGQRRVRAEVLQQQPVRSHGVGPEAGVGRRLGQQRQAVGAGEGFGDRTGVVPGKDHGAPFRKRRAAGGIEGHGERFGADPEGPVAALRRAAAPPASGTSGSRKARLSWTGPGGVSSKAPVAAASAVSTARCGFSPAGTSTAKRTCSPKRSSWTVVWLAPVPRSSSGRSAETTTSGTAAWLASITAGRRFPTAVPDVVSTATGAPVARARPSAVKPARTLIDPAPAAQLSPLPTASASA